jgi:hypothetical protein
MAKPLRNYDFETGMHPMPDETRTAVTSDSALVSRPASQAYRVLQFGFVAAPIIAGADKFFHLLVNWDQYLAPIIPRTLGIAPHTFMLGVGVIEMVAGIGVALKPKIFGYVVSAWLLGITLNLLMTGGYYDIALRDFGLALGAFALGRLSHLFDRGRIRRVARV